MLVHSVYFSLHDDSPEKIGQLISSCRDHLTGHPDTVFFAVGTLAEGLDRPVNDREFDVALQIAFESRAAHDAYQTAPRHLRFIDENRPNWKSVRVFDCDAEAS